MSTTIVLREEVKKLMQEWMESYVKRPRLGAGQRGSAPLVLFSLGVLIFTGGSF